MIKQRSFSLHLIITLLLLPTACLAKKAVAKQKKKKEITKWYQPTVKKVLALSAFAGSGYAIYAYSNNKKPKNSNNNQSNNTANTLSHNNGFAHPTAATLVHLSPKVRAHLKSYPNKKKELHSLVKQAQLPAAAFSTAESADKYEASIKRADLERCKEALLKIRALLRDAGEKTLLNDKVPTSKAIGWIDQVLTHIRFGHCINSLENKGLELVQSNDLEKVCTGIKLLSAAKSPQKVAQATAAIKRLITQGLCVDSPAYEKLFDICTSNSIHLSNKSLIPTNSLKRRMGIAQNVSRKQMFALDDAHVTFIGIMRPALGMNEAGVRLSHLGIAALGRELNKNSSKWKPFFSALDSHKRKELLHALKNMEELLLEKSNADDSFYFAVIKSYLA